MRRPHHWPVLIACLVLTWCGAVVASHFWVPETWERSLGAGLAEIPLWTGIGITSHRRALRRSRARSVLAVDPAGPQ
jgi:hypothetical protein